MEEKLGTVNEHVTCDYFWHFKESNTSFEDKSKSDWPFVVKDEILFETVQIAKCTKHHQSTLP